MVFSGKSPPITWSQFALENCIAILMLQVFCKLKAKEMLEQEIASCSQMLLILYIFQIHLVGVGGANLSLTGSKSPDNLLLKYSFCAPPPRPQRFEFPGMDPAVCILISFLSGS